MALTESERTGQEQHSRRRYGAPRLMRLPPLIGREDELARLRARLSDPDVALVTIVGPAGCGKTRLALAYIAGLSDHDAGQVAYLDLSAFHDPADVMPSIADALNVDGPPGRSSINRIAGGSGGARLLVLDNFEHLLPAAADLATLLHAAPQITCLVTSRTALQLYGEYELPLAPLALPDASDRRSLATLGLVPSVQLFVRAAQMLRPEFRLTDSNAGAVADICQRLDGLPLAIELAAARIRVLDPEALVERMTASSAGPLQLLSSPVVNMPARHQTLRGAISWSYALLSEPERALFRRFAIFAGGATIDAIEAVCLEDGDDAVMVLDRLTSLVSQSLIRRGDSGDGIARFEMLATLREFAREQLQTSDDELPVRRRHARHFLDLAESEDAAAGMHGSERLAQEYDNLRSALTWSLEDCGDPGLGLRLAGALGQFWRHRGRQREGLGWLDRALAGESHDCAARAKALFEAGNMRFALGESADALRDVEAATAMARALGDDSLLATCLTRLACMVGEQGDQEREIALYDESIALWQRLGLSRGIAKALNGLGEAARMRGDYGQARRCYEASFAAARDAHSPVCGAVLHNLGQVAQYEGDFVAAAAYFQQCLDTAITGHDDSVTCVALTGLAGAAAASGWAERAARLLGAAELLRERCNIRIDLPDRAPYERCVATTRSILGERRYAAVSDDGRRMPLAKAIADARLVDGRPADVAVGGGRPRRSATALTSREEEVARLVARGLTNRQIAEHLTIAERTVGTHIEHIMTKLACHSRAQIATWIGEHLPRPLPDPDPRRVA